MLPQGPAPRFSEDGLWWWDGARWIPTQAQSAAPAVAGVHHPNAGFWLRAAAQVIDFLAFWFASLFITIPLSVGASALDNSQGSSSSGPWSLVASIISWAIWTVGLWLYFSLQESSSAQATLGKRAMGIRVVDYEGRRVGFGRATGRYFAKYLSTLLCYVGYILAGFTERKQALHDMIASTLVVRNQPAYGPQDAGAPASSPAAAVAISVAAGAMILVLTSIVVIVILLTMGGQIKNVFSNVVVALNS